MIGDRSSMLLFGAAMLVGLVLLAIASDQFVAGCSRIAVALRLSPVVIGAVIIGAGTSLPELLVSSSAAAQGQLDIAMGNVVGSTVANLLLVLGAAALFGAIAVPRRTIRRDGPISMAGVGVLAVILIDGEIARWEAWLLLGGVIVAFWMLVRLGRDTDEAPADDGDGEIRIGGESLRTGLGLLGTLAGANLMVWGAQGAADELQLSEGFVGLTLVALGTSLPELFTSIQAARRRSTELIVGNILGSNMFNCLAIAGVVGLIAPGTLDGGVAVTGSIAMVLAGAVVTLIMISQSQVQRWEGGVLLAGYAAVVPILLI